MTADERTPGGKWVQPNGPSELGCPWCTRDFTSTADDADCTCIQWCGSPDCTQEAPDPDTAALLGAFEAVLKERKRLVGAGVLREAAHDELADINGLLWTENKQLAARVAKLEAERNHDAQVFAEWMNAVEGSDEERAAAALADRIASRIEAIVSPETGD